MSENVTSKRNKRRLLIIICTVLVLATLADIAISNALGRDTVIIRIYNTLTNRSQTRFAEEYYFDVGRSRVFTYSKNVIIAAGTLGIHALEPDGTEVLRDSFRMTTPCIKTNNAYFVIYDIGGNQIRVMSGSETHYAIETDGTITAVSVNRNGWIAVCTDESNIYKGTVTVYNNSGTPEYLVNLASGYISAAVLSQDNKNLAILNHNENGSTVTFYDLSSESLQRSFEYPNQLILDISYRPSGDIFAVAASELFIIDKRNETSTIYDFADMFLRGFSASGDYIVLHLLNYSVGYTGMTVTLDYNGRILGQTGTDKELLDIAQSADYLALLRSDGLYLFDLSLNPLPIETQSVMANTVTGIIALDNKTILAVSDRFAGVFNSGI